MKNLFEQEPHYFEHLGAIRVYPRKRYMKLERNKMNNKVSIGATTIVGWATALMALLPTVIKAVEEGQVAFNGPEKYLAVFGIASGVITQVARYLQAHKLIGVSSVENVSNIISDFEDVPAPGTSVGDIAKVATVVDAKDNPSVPLSGA